jgi:4-hydroxybenzoate polyprenyltransferase
MMESNDTKTIIAFVFYFMLVKDFINTVLYDIRDVEGDRETGIQTIPLLLGPRKTTALLLALNTTLLPWLVLANPCARPLATALVLYGYAYILYFRKIRGPLALDFFVDGEYMIAVVLFLVKDALLA